jgi:SAM-dependent methyltransferase
MNSTYQQIDGIKCYAPELAMMNDYFPEEYLRHLYEIEDKNFWYRSRNRVIKQLFKKHLGTNVPKTIMEIGCGNGFILKGLMEHKNYALCGADIHIRGLKNAKERLPALDFIQLDATNMPFKNEFDAIGAFDVLEHIEDDVIVIKNTHAALKTNGKFLISVPQYQWMWSHMDDLDNHKRRYTRKELKNKLTQNGFEVTYMSSFVFTLFPIMVVSRYFKKNKKFQEQDFKEKLTELRLSSFTNFVLETFMRVDELILRTGISLPFGGSLIAVAKKKN